MKIKQWVKHNLCPQILYNLDSWGLFIKLGICHMPSDPCWHWLMAWELPIRGSWYAENRHGTLWSNLEYHAKITMWDLEKRNYDQILKVTGLRRCGRVLLGRRKCTWRERAGGGDGITAHHYYGQSSCCLWKGAMGRQEFWVETISFRGKNSVMPLERSPWGI